MQLNFNLSGLTTRLVVVFGLIIVCGLLFVVIFSRFVVGTLSDDRLLVTRDTLRFPVEYFPGSARLNARLAAAELEESDRDLAIAEVSARRAVMLSPNDYRFRLTLASAQEANGNRGAAEDSLRAALVLAPHYWDVHYRLGNLLVRAGRLSGAVDELRLAVAANSELLPGTLDLIWRASKEDARAVRAVTGDGGSDRLTLAQFLVNASRPNEATEIFEGIDRSTRLAAPKESSAFLNSLISAGKLETARALLGDLIGRNDQDLISNGGFEFDILRDFSQFDWSFNRSEYARLAIDGATAHMGTRSLRIEFTGRDTTRLDDEIKQLVPVRAGARYMLECYVKTSGLDSPEGPKVVVTENGSSAWVAASEPIANGSHEWQRLTLDFVAPQRAAGESSVLISIKRKPRFSYDDPTRGTVWFDDFLIKEQ
jgi:tetratricopeptide (TPR) repeat protein